MLNDKDNIGEKWIDEAMINEIWNMDDWINIYFTNTYLVKYVYSINVPKADSCVYSYGIEY